MDGLNTVLRALTGELTKRGVAVEFISTWPGRGRRLGRTLTIDQRESWHLGPVFRGVGRGKWRLHNLPLVAIKRVDRWLSNHTLRRTVRSYGPETLLVFTNVRAKTRFDQAGAGRRRNGPLWIGQHHSSFESVAASAPAVDETQRHFADLDAFVALTQEDAAGFATLLPSVRCVAIGNPLPVGTYPASSRRPIAIALGRYSPEKQLDLMIEVFLEATAIPNLRHWQLHLYGEGYDEDRLRRIVGTSDPSGRVQLRGRVDDVGTVTSTASVHLLTSQFEGWGMCIVEAALSAVPTIAFDCAPGVREVIGRSAGTLVPPDDRIAFTRHLRASLLDASLLQRQGEEARRHVAQYETGLIVDRWGWLVRACLDERPVQ